MTIRRATPDDAPTIAALEAAAAGDPWSLAQVRATLERPTTHAWLVGDPARGHLLTTQVLDEAEILTIAVHPAHRRRGLARQLLTCAEAAWQSHGVVTAWLEVRVSNVAARALYRSRGWVDVDVRSRYYADGSDAARMRWEAPWFSGS